MRTIPKPTGLATRVILHLYSGQRREGDFQYWYEHFTAPDDLSTYVLSIDIANNATTGDLTNWDTVNFWLNQMAKDRTYVDVPSVGVKCSYKYWKSPSRLCP